MKKISFLFTAFLLLQFGLSTKAQQVDIKLIEQIIDSARITYNVPGIAVGIVQNNKIIFAKGFGTSTYGKNEPVNENTQFGIASNTKAFTALGITMLAEEGKLSLDDKVIKHLPWFKSYNDYTTNEMTIRDLLTHHSGLKTFSGDLIWYASNHSREEIVKRSQHLQPAFGFREKFGYSNIHYLAAGLIIEKVSGKSFDEFIKERIFTPLKMTTTNTSISSNPKTNVATPHAIRYEKVIPIPYVNWDNIAPAGSINSNVKDMCKWLQFLLNNGKKGDTVVVQPKTLYNMYQAVTPLPVSGFSQKMHPTKHFNAYGLGFNLFDYHGVKVVNHSGGLDGMISHLAFVPEKNFGLVILSNGGTGLPGILLYDLLDQMLQQKPNNYYKQYHKIISTNEANEKAEEEKTWKDATKGKKHTLDHKLFSGRYKGNVYGEVVITEKKGQLHFTLTHSPSFHADLHYLKDNVFWFEFLEHPSLPKGTITFNINKENKIVNMVIDCPNPDFDFTELDLFKE